MEKLSNKALLFLMLFTLLPTTDPRLETSGKSLAMVTKETLYEASRTKILTQLQKRLPAQERKSAAKIADVIMAESALNKIDPLIVTAIISGESGFNPRAKGFVGEIGLMQLRPETAEWICKFLKLKWKGEKSLYNPSINIQIGTAYLAYLRRELSPHGGYLYLSAYNMGIGNVLKLLSKNKYPKIYSTYIMEKYLALIQTKEG